MMGHFPGDLVEQVISGGIQWTQAACERSRICAKSSGLPSCNLQSQGLVDSFALAIEARTLMHEEMICTSDSDKSRTFFPSAANRDQAQF